MSPFSISITLSQFSRKHPNKYPKYPLSISQTNKALSKNSHLYASVFTLKYKLLKYSQITKIREKLCCLLHSGQLPWSENWCLNSSISTDCWWFSNILGAAVRSVHQKELKRYDDLAHVLGTWAHLLKILCSALLPSMEKYNLTSSNLFIAVYYNRIYSRRRTYSSSFGLTLFLLLLPFH